MTTNAIVFVSMTLLTNAPSRPAFTYTNAVPDSSGAWTPKAACEAVLRFTSPSGSVVVLWNDSLTAMTNLDGKTTVTNFRGDVATNNWWVGTPFKPITELLPVSDGANSLHIVIPATSNSFLQVQWRP